MYLNFAYLILAVHLSHANELPTYTLPPMLSLTQYLTSGDSYRWFNARCTQWGDSLGQGQAQGRNRWALSCYSKRSRELNERIKTQPERARELVDESLRAMTYTALIRNVETNNEGISGPKRYATFGMWNPETNEPVNPDHWMAPISETDPCELPRAEFALVAFCVEGCFSSGQVVRFEEGEFTIPRAISRKGLKVMTVAEGSTLQSVHWQATPIKGFVETLGRSDQEVVRITTESGHTLTVTPNHPILIHSGALIEARNLQPHDLLILETGEWSAISRLSTEHYFGKVYNLTVDSENPIENLVSSGGIVNGSVYFQNEGSDWMNRLLMRVNLQL